MLKFVVFTTLFAIVASRRFGTVTPFDNQPVQIITVSPRPQYAETFFTLLSNYLRNEGIQNGPIEVIRTPQVMKKLTFQTTEQKYITFLAPQVNQVQPRRLVKTLVEIPQQIDVAVVVVPYNDYVTDRSTFVEQRVLAKQYELLQKIGHVRHIITVIDRNIDSQGVSVTKLNQLRNEIQSTLATVQYQIGSTVNPVVEIDLNGLTPSSRSNIQNFVQTLDNVVRNGVVDRPSLDDPFFFVIEQVEQQTSEEVVVVGKVLDGQITVGEQIVLQPDNVRGSIKTIETIDEQIVRIVEGGEKVRLTIKMTQPVVQLEEGDVVTKLDMTRHAVPENEVQVVNQFQAIVYVPVSVDETRIYRELPAFTEPGYNFQPQPIQTSQSFYVDFYKGLYRVPVETVEIIQTVDLQTERLAGRSSVLRQGRLAIISFTTQEPIPVKEGLSFFLLPRSQETTVVATGRVVFPSRINKLPVHPLTALNFYTNQL